MKEKLCLLLTLTALSVTASTLPFLETFDGLTNNASIQNQNGWTVDSGAGAIIQSGTAVSNQALEIQNTQISHALTSTGTSAWVSFQARISAKPDANPSVTNVNTSVAFFVNTNLNLVVYNGTNPVVLNTQIPTNIWTRFDVYCDYDIQKWTLSINGTNVASSLGLYSSGTTVESVLIANNSSTSVYLDTLAIQDTEPAGELADTDGDSIPDWWELCYFGGITNASPTDIAQNGMTYLQAYIAGMDPSNSTETFKAVRGEGRKISWERKTGRQYDIYWASNLISGFSFIYTAPGSEFEDTNVARTESASGFYQIRVHK